ncbi:hypothetical protein C2L92_05810 [Coxiella burnetii]|nr:hypothetical protein A35_10495 [Coxiella burnetii 'MSU Goat Q177']ATN68025.1 hypothetical protein AYM00_01480 [Coxiella burnetii]ATN77173.1 hypothetical protein AYM94_10005 [Coxiella burnetii]ATN79016.1 hypothetical protein AYM93_09585 [Coxiella burnetii]ATN83171.1 hypothetical protein AYO23_00325 [Coxiella burnetii]
MLMSLFSMINEKNLFKRITYENFNFQWVPDHPLLSLVGLRKLSPTYGLVCEVCERGGFQINNLLISVW